MKDERIGYGRLGL